MIFPKIFILACNLPISAETKLSFGRKGKKPRNEFYGGRFMEGRRFFRMSSLVLSLCFLWLLSGCGGGGSSSTAVTTPPGSSNPTQTPTDTQTTAGIALPQEVSAISADNDATAAQTSGLRARLMAVADAASQLPADSDYQTEVAAKYVDEPALQVFDIIDTILKAVVPDSLCRPGQCQCRPLQDDGELVRNQQRAEDETGADMDRRLQDGQRHEHRRYLA